MKRMVPLTLGMALWLLAPLGAGAQDTGVSLSTETDLVVSSLHRNTGFVNDGTVGSPADFASSLTGTVILQGGEFLKGSVYGNLVLTTGLNAGDTPTVSFSQLYFKGALADSLFPFPSALESP